MSERTARLRALLEGAAARGGIAVTGHDRADVDSAVSCVLMQRLLRAWGLPCRIALCAPDAQARRVLARFGLDAQAMSGAPQDAESLILVDHHQCAHAGRIVACIDHHPTACPPDAPYVQIEQAGACAVMVLALMREAGVPVAAQDEALAVAALYLDTIALRSTKIRREEAAWGEAQARRLGLDTAWLLREGLQLQDMGLPAGTLCALGKKTYSFGARRVISSYVQTDAMTQETLQAILAEIRAQMARERADLWVFLVHDPVRGRSTEYDVTPDGRVRTIAYDALISRGRDVMPRVEREMQEERP